MFSPRKSLPPPGDTRRTAVLVVEDDPEQQVVLAHALRAHCHSIIAASSGAGACALIGEWPVDLVLVSQEIPGTTGIEVTRALLDRYPQLRIVLLTSEASPGLYASARESGAFDCVSRVSVSARLGSWLRMPDPEEEEDNPSLRTLDAAAQLAE